MKRAVGLFLVSLAGTGMAGCGNLIGLVDVPDLADGGSDGGVPFDASMGRGEAGLDAAFGADVDAGRDAGKGADADSGDAKPGLDGGAVADGESADSQGSDGSGIDANPDANQCVADGGPCSALADGTPVIWPTGAPVGVCKYGHLACGADGGVQCLGAVAPGTRSCGSAMDNDCDDEPDNTIDNICQCASGMTYSCIGAAPNNCAGTRTCDTDNPASYQLGTCNAPANCMCTPNTETRTCGGTACQVTQTCQADGTWPTCSLPSNCACTGTQTASCLTSTYSCPGTETCSNYQWGSCMAISPSTCMCTNGDSQVCNSGDCNESTVTCANNTFPCPAPVTASACTTQGVIEGTTQSCGGATTCPGVACPAPTPALCSVNGCPGYSCGGGCTAVQSPQTFTVGGTLPSTSTNGLAATFTGCTIAFADFTAPPPPAMPPGAYDISYTMAIHGTSNCSSGTRFVEQFTCSSLVPVGGACSVHPGLCEAPCDTGTNSSENFVFDANDFTNGATATITCPPSDSIILTHLQKDTTSCTYSTNVTSVTWTYTVCQ